MTLNRAPVALLMVMVPTGYHCQVVIVARLRILLQRWGNPKSSYSTKIGNVPTNIGEINYKKIPEKSS